jgi:hypothetical protein
MTTTGPRAAPAELFGKPHFDFHFYLATRPERPAPDSPAAAPVVRGGGSRRW